jgi:hypothetical protein
MSCLTFGVELDRATKEPCKTMKTHRSEYVPCRGCFFYVRATDRYCPNCGRQHPGRTPLASFKADFPRVFLTALLSTLGGLGIGVLLQPLMGGFWLFAGMMLGLLTGLLWIPAEQKPERNENDVRDNAYIASSTVMGSLVTAVATAAGKSDYVLEHLFIATLQGAFWGSLLGFGAILIDRAAGGFFQRFLSRFSRNRSIKTLREQERAAEERIAQIRQREKQINHSLQQVEAQGDDLRWRQLAENLQRARAILQEQLECCQLELMQIMLIRWYNRLQPLQSEWVHLDYAACNHRLEELQQTHQLGREHLSAWQHRLSFKTPSGQHGLQLLTEQLQKGLESCHALEQVLIERKAVLSLQGTLPAVPVETSASELLQVQSGLFHASVQALEEFGEMYHQLETEYSQLVSEGKLTQT